MDVQPLTAIRRCNGQHHESTIRNNTTNIFVNVSCVLLKYEMWEWDFESICLSKESKTTRDGDEKDFGISHIYCHEYSSAKALYGKDNLGGLYVHDIEVYSIVFIILHHKLT
jgi:hypothetical protein